MLSEQIKQEVFTFFRDDKYGKTTLMELFFKDRHLLYSRYKNNKMSKETIDFFKQNVERLLMINETISIQFFREQKYKELIDEYCIEKVKTEQNKNESRDNVFNVQVKEREDSVSEATIYIYSKKVNDLKYKKYIYKQYTMEKNKYFNCPLCKKKQKNAVVFEYTGRKIICCPTCMKEMIGYKKIQKVILRKNQKSQKQKRRVNCQILWKSLQVKLIQEVCVGR